jgi:hypothetical protein
MNKIDVIVEGYLISPDSLYEEWYKKKLLKEAGLAEGEFTGILPSKEKIKELHDIWLNEKILILKEKICINWGYSQKRIQHSDDVELIKDLANYLGNIIDFPLEVAVSVFISGLDMLCFQ